MKKWLPLLIFICLACTNSPAFGQTSVDFQPFRESLAAQLEALNLGDLLDFAQLVEGDLQEYLPSLNLDAFLSRGKSPLQPTDLFSSVIRYLLKELYLNLHLLRQLVVIGILAALLQRLSTSFGIKGIVDLAFGVCFLVLVLIALQSFQITLALASRTVDNMVSFMYALLPTLSTLLLAVGGITSTTVFHPLLMGLVGAIAGLVEYLLFPMILFSTVFSLVAHFSSEFPLVKLGALLRQGAITLLGIFFLVFSGFMAFQGAIAPVSDGISLRTAKYFTKTLIPIAGGMFADTLEVVIGGSLLIKNGVGVFGLVMVVLLVATPLLKVWASVLVYKLVGAILEPICEPRLIQVLGTMESALILVFISLGVVAVMFLIAVSVLVGVGNLTVFMR